MALRIGDSAIRGEIDNRVRGRVTGEIWIAGCDKPVQLDLHGNCLRDIAGHHVVFECSSPQPLKHAQHVNPVQAGDVGDMTASRKVTTWAVSFEEAQRLRDEGREVPLRKANCLYLEWFSEANGRVVLESTEFRIKEMSDPVWRMDRDGEQRQIAENVKGIRDFIERVQEAKEEQRASWSPEEDEPFDEFKWEQTLRESDERTDRYGEVMEKYHGHPDAEKLIAREMGWDWLDDALDADERGAFEDDKAAMEMEELPELEPIPETEGVDWIRTEDGDIRHPLAHRAAEVSHEIWHTCDDKGLMGEGGDDDVADMAFEAHMLSAKLAGALNGLAYREEPDPGFVVAYLKRALKFFDSFMAAGRKVEEKDLLDPALLQSFRRKIFEIREEILNVMKRYREELG